MLPKQQNTWTGTYSTYWTEDMPYGRGKCLRSQKNGSDADSVYFYHGLMTELKHDAQLFYDEWSERAGIALSQVREDEDYHIACYNPFATIRDDHSLIMQKRKEYKGRVKPLVKIHNSTHDAKKVAEAYYTERKQASEDRKSVV